jgi:Ca2+-dependent lipid-binding protein
LYLNIQSAWGVADKDVGGLSDPYAVVKLENSQSHEEYYEFKTKSINDTLDPVWDHSERVEGGGKEYEKCGRSDLIQVNQLH